MDLEAEDRKIAVVAIALGGGCEGVALRHLANKYPDAIAQELQFEFLKMARFPGLREWAREIVLREAILHFAHDEPVGKFMQGLIAGWCQRELDGITKDARTKLLQSNVQWAFIEWTLQNPQGKREAIVQALMEKFGLKRRRIFDFIKGIEPEQYAESGASKKCNQRRE